MFACAYVCLKNKDAKYGFRMIGLF